MPIRTTVVGCGAVAQKLYRKPLKKLEGQGVLQVVALVDRNLGHARALHEAFPRATVHEDQARALEEGRAELTLVLSPARFHAEQSILALRHRSHVLCEKPMAPTESQCDEMIVAAKESRRVLAVGMVRRFLPAFAQ